MSATIKVDTSAAIKTLNDMIRELVPAKHFALQDAGAFMVKTARQKVHIITGRTQKSTKVVSVSGNQVICESAWGAPFEEARGDPHDFITQTLTELNTEFPRIISNRYSRIFGGGIIR